MKERELLTSSRMISLLSCPRKHYYQYEIGLCSDSDAAALRIGSAWHKAMEMRWKGEGYDNALESSLPEGDLNELEATKIMALLAGYYKYYENERIFTVYPEIQFDLPLDHSRTFNVAGKIDGLGVLETGEQVLLEHKTTGEDISNGSDYWLRLRFNGQIMQYLLAARRHGWNPSEIIYDVVRKPSINPKEVPVLDENGKKIVLDDDNQRVFKTNGEPRESSDSAKRYTLQTALETAQQYGDRLLRDVQERPEFYFARRRVPVLDQDLQEFEVQRLVLAQNILYIRRAQKQLAKPEQAWPRNCNGITCKCCAYSTFCLQNISVDVNMPPPGFKIAKIHQELN